MKNEFIKFNDYSLILDDEIRLKNINLMIKKNTILTIIGPSRAGKVNLLRSLNLTNQLFHKKVEIRGEILIDKTNIIQNYDLSYLRRKNAYISAKPIMYNGTVWDNLTLGVKIHNVPEKYWANYIRYSLDALESWEYFKDKLDLSVKKLSKLDQLKISFARVIALNPNILLVEDFTRYIDISAFLEFSDVFIKLRRKFTILMVCYDNKHAAKLGTHTLLLIDGRVIECNETRRFFERPVKKETEEYLSGKFF